MLSASSYDNTAYSVTRLSKDIKRGKLPQDYHVVLDEGYVCSQQEMTPYKGRNLTREQDVFNYYLSRNRQVIERAFGILIQRWGVFWRPLRVSMIHRDLVIRVACKLHNICVEDFGECIVHTVQRDTVPQFMRDCDHQVGDIRYPRWLRVPIFDTTRNYGQGHRSDLERCDHRTEWTNIIRNDRSLKRPTTSRGYKLKRYSV
jgi:hypothetical protein